MGWGEGRQGLPLVAAGAPLWWDGLLHQGTVSSRGMSGAGTVLVVGMDTGCQSHTGGADLLPAIPDPCFILVSECSSKEPSVALAMQPQVSLPFPWGSAPCEGTGHGPSGQRPLRIPAWVGLPPSSRPISLGLKSHELEPQRKKAGEEVQQQMSPETSERGGEGHGAGDIGEAPTAHAPSSFLTM